MSIYVCRLQDILSRIRDGQWTWPGRENQLRELLRQAQLACTALALPPLIDGDFDDVRFKTPDGERWRYFKHHFPRASRRVFTVCTAEFKDFLNTWLDCLTNLEQHETPVQPGVVAAGTAKPITDREDVLRKTLAGYQALQKEYPDWDDKQITKELIAAQKCAPSTVYRNIKCLRVAKELPASTRKPRELSNQMHQINPVRCDNR